MEYRLSPVSIFGRKQDLFAFTSWIWIAVLLLLLSFAGIIVLDKVKTESILLVLLVNAIAQTGHVYATFYISFFDKEVYKKTKWLLIVSTLFVFFFAFFSVINSVEQYFYIFSGYISIMHLVRQEFGWMKIILRKEGHGTKLTNRIDLFTSYCLTLCPTIWILRESINGYWLVEGDIFLFDDRIALFAMVTCFIAIFLSFVSNAYLFKKHGVFSVGKFLVYLNSFFGWFVPLYLITSSEYRIIGAWMLAFAHGIPYIFAVFKVQNLSVVEKLGIKDNPILKYLFLYGLIFLAFILIYRPATNLSLIPDLSIWTKALVVGFLAVPTIGHCIYDAFLWRKNVGLTKRLEF